MAGKSTSPWVWLGCGCAAIVGIGIVVVGAAAFFGLQTAKTMADPDARRDKALSILSAGAIPEGYETELAMSIPFFADIVVLEGQARQFVYLKGLRSKGDLEAAFDDEESFDRELRRAGLKISRRQKILARDATRIGAAEIRYVLVDGEIEFNASGSGTANFDFDDEENPPEVSAVVLLRCSTDDPPALAMWAGQSANPGPDAEIEDPATDQAALVDLIEQFGFCRG